VITISGYFTGVSYPARSPSINSRAFAHSAACLLSIFSTFYVRIFRTNVRFGSFFYVHVTRKSCQNGRSYEKFVRRMLMKLTPVVNFFNILCPSFMCRCSYAKKLQSLTVIREKLHRTISYKKAVRI